MELTKKTTILFPPDLYDRLAALAIEKNSSVGELVREACRRQYGRATRDERLAAVAALSALALPVGTPEEMEIESTPRAQPVP
ncbi:MAG: CopG family transcriptional regulator [Bryobacteraceae bacterium]